MANTDKITWIGGMFGGIDGIIDIGHVEQIVPSAKVYGSDIDGIGCNWVILTNSLLILNLIFENSGGKYIPTYGTIGVLPERFRNKMKHNALIVAWGSPVSFSYGEYYIDMYAYGVVESSSGIIRPYSSYYNLANAKYVFFSLAAPLWV